MFGFFPPLQEEELLYSAIVRYGTLIDCGPTKRRGLGIPSALWSCYSVRNPTGIDRLLASLPPGHGLDSCYIVENHTLAPYTLAFCTQQQAAKLRVRIASGEGAVPGRFGAMASSFEDRFGLRVCKECALADVGRVGRPYWRRGHQLPGVLVCPVHEGPLIETIARGPRFATVSELAPLSTELIKAGREISMPASLHAPALRLSRSSQRILENAFAGYELITLQGALRDLLAACGYSWNQAPSLLSMERLSTAFLRHPTVDEILKRSTPTRSADQVALALNRLLYNSSVAKHPLAVLLLLEFMEVGIDELLLRCKTWAAETRHAAENSNERRRVAPCANLACRRFNGKPQKQLATLGLPLQRHRFKCSACEFEYSWDPARPATIVVLRTGPKWDDALRTALLADQSSLRKLAKLLGVSTNTVKRQARRIGLWNPMWLDSPKLRMRRDDRKAMLREKFRIEWLRSRNLNPNATQKELTRTASCAYRFLHQHDREWLSRNHPLTRKRRLKTIDWDQFDIELIGRLDKLLAGNANVPSHRCRFTLTDIGWALRAANTIVKYREKLPGLWARIDAYLNDSKGLAKRNCGA